MSKNKYPEYIMKRLREREGLGENDTREDEYLNTLTPNETLKEMLEWEGLLGYAETIKGWIKDIYGVDLNDIK